MGTGSIVYPVFHETLIGLKDFDRVLRGKLADPATVLRGVENFEVSLKGLIANQDALLPGYTDVFQHDSALRDTLIKYVTPEAVSLLLDISLDVQAIRCRLLGDLDALTLGDMSTWTLNEFYYKEER